MRGSHSCDSFCTSKTPVWNILLEESGLLVYHKKPEPTPTLLVRGHRPPALW